MSVNVPNPGSYQAQLGNHCVAFRDALQDLLNDSTYLTAMGGASFLETSLGLSAADATAVMSSVGAVTASNTTVQAIQAWIATTEFLWGGA